MDCDYSVLLLFFNISVYIEKNTSDRSNHNERRLTLPIVMEMPSFDLSTASLLLEKL